MWPNVLFWFAFAATFWPFLTFGTWYYFEFVRTNKAEQIWTARNFAWVSAVSLVLPFASLNECESLNQKWQTDYKKDVIIIFMFELPFRSKCERTQLKIVLTQLCSCINPSAFTTPFDTTYWLRSSHLAVPRTYTPHSYVLCMRVRLRSAQSVVHKCVTHIFIHRRKIQKKNAQNENKNKWNACEWRRNFTRAEMKELMRNKHQHQHGRNYKALRSAFRIFSLINLAWMCVFRERFSVGSGTIESGSHWL